MLMYRLVLTKAERDAIDCIGNRYATGNEFYEILTAIKPSAWDSDGVELFEIPENLAWEIRELFEKEQFRFPCFSVALATKLQQFADQIV